MSQLDRPRRRGIAAKSRSSSKATDRGEHRVKAAWLRRRRRGVRDRQLLEPVLEGETLARPALALSAAAWSSGSSITVMGPPLIKSAFSFQA